jgi:hypothetical protein
MNTIFDPALRAALIARIQTLDQTRTAQWGKMNVYQMVRHCNLWEGWIQGTPPRPYKQELLGRVFGKMALRKLIKDDQPFAKNIPTSKQFQIADSSGDLEAEKRKWIARLEAYDRYSNPDFIHDFFGRMTQEEIGQLAYKHTDHHLRQFGA